MNWSNVRRSLRNDGYTDEEIEVRIDELLDHHQAEDEPPKQGKQDDAGHRLMDTPALYLKETYELRTCKTDS